MSTRAGARRRRGKTAAELATRWAMSEEKAVEFLELFVQRGYATRRGELYYATQRASRVRGFGPEEAQ